MAVDSNLRILLVEDSGITRKMEVKALKGAGFTNIVEAEDGDDAITKLQSEEGIGLIISDWNMPNRNGFDLLVWVRADESCRDIPFIMATAQSEKKQTTMAVEAGVSNFITKPFGPPELKTVIEDTFSGKAEKARQEPKQSWEAKIGPSGKPVFRVAHIQITDHLTLGVMNHMIDTEKFNPKHFVLERHCMPSWNPVQQALENGEIDAAFILAPIAMDLFNYGVPLKLVMFAHKNGSICVRKRDGADTELTDFFRGRTFYIPHILSIHHMLSTMFLRELGLSPGLAGQEGVDSVFEVVPPIKMPEFLVSNPEAGGFNVAEPLGTKAIATGNAELMFLSGELWEYHPCCVVVFREEVVKRFPEAVGEFSSLLVDSGQFIATKPEQAAEIAVNFLDPDKTLGLNVPVLKNVLNEPQGIKTDDLFPVKADLDRIQHYMVDEMGIGSIVDLDAFVDTSFAEKAYKERATTLHSSRLHDISEVVNRIRNRGEDVSMLANLDREGKYLFFNVDDEQYGVSVLSVKEIVSIMNIKTIPKTPEFVKGVINLRGKVIPVVDMRTRFGLEEREYDKHTCIVVVESGSRLGLLQLGLIVDTVSDVVNIKAADIVETPSFGVNLDTRYIMAMAKMEGGVKTLLNVGSLFGESELEMFGALSS